MGDTFPNHNTSYIIPDIETLHSTIIGLDPLGKCSTDNSKPHVQRPSESGSSPPMLVVA